MAVLLAAGVSQWRSYSFQKLAARNVWDELTETHAGRVTFEDVTGDDGLVIDSRMVLTM